MWGQSINVVKLTALWGQLQLQKIACQAAVVMIKKRREGSLPKWHEKGKSSQKLHRMLSTDLPSDIFMLRVFSGFGGGWLFLSMLHVVIG